MEKNKLSFQTSKVKQPLATINRIHTIFHSITILALFYYRASILLFHGSHEYPNSLTTKTHKLSWILLFISEFLLSLYWFLGQAYRWRPISRTIFLERLPSEEDEEEDEVVLPSIDVFICTADPKKEPTIEVMNTVISAMSLDYPPHKLSVYLSDDAGSSITLYAIKEAFLFAKSWIPFCKKYRVETRCPETYFSFNGGIPQQSSSSINDDELMRNKDIIKSKYEIFKDRVRRAIENDDDDDQKVSSSPMIEVIGDNEKPNESEESKVPLLVYVAREKSPFQPHHFKAGALNVLLRVSGLISNSPYILVLDCDMYCNDSLSARQAMCFHLDPQISKSLAFVQFPQNFHNLSENDIYNSLFRTVFQTLWYGIDGIKGPILSGTGFYIKRKALYGFSIDQNIEDVNQPQFKQKFGHSKEFTKFSTQNHKFNVIDNGGNESNSLLEEARVLATCAYEKNTGWGEEIGFMYHSVLEDYFTGFLLHCKGWNSAYYVNHSKPSFLGCVTTNLNDTLVQTTRWNSGMLQVGLSKFCPLTYGVPKMSILQSMAYAYFAMLPIFTSLPFLCFAIIPQLCFFHGIPLYPKVSSNWFYVFLALYVSVLFQSMSEILISGGSLRLWWYEYRILMIKSVTASFFAFLDVLMKFLGLKEIIFLPTNKVIDEEQAQRYKMGIFDFRTGTMFLLPLTTISILNMVSLVFGLRRVFMDRSLDEMFGQIFISLQILTITYAIIEAMILRKDNGRIPSFVTFLSISILMVFFSFEALLV